MRRFVAFQVLPVLFLLVVAILPMALGRQTLYQRDVMNAHLPAKAAQAAAFADLELPLIDVARGGQPLLGNLNTLTLYPSSLLLPIDPVWALNAHFWLHWLLAPFAFAWMARACGLGRPAAWAGGVLYATGGYYLSLMNLFNLIPAATLTPALIAALLDGFGRWPRAEAPAEIQTAPAEIQTAPAPRFAVVGLLWALLLLSGDPFSVLLAVMLAASAIFALRRPLPKAPALWSRLVLALVLGSACAAPVWVEFLRILPFSFRAAISHQTVASLTQSVPPASIVEWFWPLIFGPYDFSFWGAAVYDQGASLIFSQFPGVLALALIVAAGRPRGNPASRWAWGWLVAGVLLAFGRHNPLVAWLYELPGVPALRFPIKFWLLVAIAGALLAALGFERFLHGGGRRLLAGALTALGVLYLAAFLGMLFAPDGLRDLVSGIDPAALPGPAFEEERLRLMWTGLKLAAGAGLLALATLLHRRSLAVAGAALLILHTVFQLNLLAPLIETDDADIYRQPPPLAARVPPEAMLIHGTFDAAMFGRTPMSPRERFPDLRHFWLNRCRHLEMGPPTSALLRRPYDLSVSPEGLDSNFGVLGHYRFEKAEDGARVRALAALGVDYLVLDRPLDPTLGATRVAGIEGGCSDHSALYRLDRAAAAYQMAGRLLVSKSAREAFDLMSAEGFDPRISAVLADDGHQQPIDLPAGQVLQVEARRHTIRAEVDSPAGGVFMTRRAYLPIYRAEIDGQPATPILVNAYRLGLKVPAGRHRLELGVDRGPTRFGVGAALLGLVGLLVLAARSRGA